MLIFPERHKPKKKIDIVSFQNGTVEQLVTMLQAHYNGDINIYDYWNVGDHRTVRVRLPSATEKVNSTIGYSGNYYTSTGYKYTSPYDDYTSKELYILDDNKLGSDEGYRVFKCRHNNSWKSKAFIVGFGEFDKTNNLYPIRTSYVNKPHAFNYRTDLYQYLNTMDITMDGTLISYYLLRCRKPSDDQQFFESYNGVEAFSMSNTSGNISSNSSTNFGMLSHWITIPSKGEYNYWNGFKYFRTYSNRSSLSLTSTSQKYWCRDLKSGSVYTFNTIRYYSGDTDFSDGSASESTKCGINWVIFAI